MVSLIFSRNNAEKYSKHCHFARRIAFSQKAWIIFCPGLLFTPFLRFYPLETGNRNVTLKKLNQKHLSGIS